MILCAHVHVCAYLRSERTLSFALIQEFYLVCLAPPPHAWQALAEESERAQMHAWP